MNTNVRALCLLLFSTTIFSCAKKNSPTFSLVYGGNWRLKEKTCNSSSFSMDSSELIMSLDLKSGVTVAQTNNCHRETHYSISVAQNTIVKNALSCVSSCENDSGLSQFCASETGSIQVVKNENDRLEVLENDGDCRAIYEKVN